MCDSCEATSQFRRGNGSNWGNIICVNCGNCLRDPGIFGFGYAADYFVKYNCPSCDRVGICKICKKQLGECVKSDDLLSSNVHLMTHYNIEEFEPVHKIPPDRVYSLAMISDLIPYLFLLGVENSLANVIESSFEENPDGFGVPGFAEFMIDKVMESNHFCVICSYYYDSFPTVDAVIHHLKQYHGLIDSRKVNVFNYRPCTRPHVDQLHNCFIDSGITKCDSGIHITKIDKLIPIKAVLASKKLSIQELREADKWPYV